MKEYTLPTEQDKDPLMVYLGRIFAMVGGVSAIALAHHLVTTAVSGC